MPGPIGGFLHHDFPRPEMAQQSPPVMHLWRNFAISWRASSTDIAHSGNTRLSKRSSSSSLVGERDRDATGEPEALLLEGETALTLRRVGYTAIRWSVDVLFGGRYL